MDIALNFVNRSNDTNNSDIVIFQKNGATNANERAVAWTVIHNCGPGSNHPFLYSRAIAVAASDRFGNYTPQQPAAPGDAFQLVLKNTGHQLIPTGSTTGVRQLRVVNALSQDAIGAHIYRGGRLLAISTGITPQQRAAFEFEPIIWIGAVSMIGEGADMHPEIASSCNTAFSLDGILSADIVMSGGGPGASAKPFAFHLEKVVVS